MWDFRSLSSFVRQLSYYNFKRLSDRRRSNERRASATGYIVFTHPSGFFVRGDASNLGRIARKLRPRPNKVGAAGGRPSAQYERQGDDEEYGADGEHYYSVHDRRASTASSGGSTGYELESPRHNGQLELPPLPAQHRPHNHLTYEPVGTYRDGAFASQSAYFQSPFSPQYTVASTSLGALPPPSTLHSQPLPRHEQQPSRAVSRLSDVSTWRSYSPATMSWQTSYHQLANRRMSQPDYRMSSMLPQTAPSYGQEAEQEDVVDSRPRLRKAASSLSITTADASHSRLCPTPALSPYNTTYYAQPSYQSRMPIASASNMSYSAPRYSSVNSTTAAMTAEWQAHGRQASLPSPSGSSNPVTPQDEIINPLDNRRASFVNTTTNHLVPNATSRYVADSIETPLTTASTTTRPLLPIEDDLESSSSVAATIVGKSFSRQRLSPVVVNDSWQLPVVPGY
ncbi:hypothetical protein OIV83_004220 [Microbotryomycetes sp. JL201]|nr:hypothetical protein OIV83_004220 [Microbotryomycetes sp. JL201]